MIREMLAASSMLGVARGNQKQMGSLILDYPWARPHCLGLPKGKPPAARWAHGSEACWLGDAHSVGSWGILNAAFYQLLK